MNALKLEKSRRKARTALWDKKLNRISAIFAILVAVPSIIKIICGIIPPGNEKMKIIEVTGTVRDRSTDQGIIGARVSIDGEEFIATTNQYGLFMGTLKHLPSETHVRFRVTHHEYKPYFEDRQVAPPLAVELLFYLDKLDFNDD